MAYGNRIKGITIEIGGDTTKLQTALKGVNSNISASMRELKDIDRLLKNDPMNSTLLQQKQQNLATAINETTAKLDKEKLALQQLQQKEQTPEVVRQQQNLQREIIATEQSLKNLKQQYNDFGSVAKQQIMAVGDKMQALGGKISSVGASLSSAGRSMTFGLTTPIVAGFSSAIKTGADFEKQMSNVKAVSGATGEEFESLKQAAKDFGEATVFSASESADALYYMGLAGWSPKESINALGGVLNLAAAGATDLGTTSDIVTDSMTAFGLSANGVTNGLQNAEHFSNTLAAAMSNSNTTVEMLGESFKYVAPVAGAMGYNIEDVSIALGLMANSGVKASMAGTTLRTLLTNMANPTKDMVGAMYKLGVSLDDGEGNMLSLMDIMLKLRSGFGNLKMPVEEFNEHLAALDESLENGTRSQKDYDKEVQKLIHSAFGAEQALQLEAAAMLTGKRGLSGLMAIVNASDEEFQALTNSIYSADQAFVRHEGHVYTLEEAYKQFGDRIYKDKAFEVLGAAEGMAAIQLDNLSGKWTLFKSKLDTAKIAITEASDGALGQLIDKLSAAVDWFNSLDSAQQQNIVKIAMLVAAVGPLLMITGSLFSAIGNIISVGGTLVKGIGTVVGLFTKVPVAVAAVSNVSTASLIPSLGGVIGTLGSLVTAAAPFLVGGAVIAGVIAAGVLVYKNWDTIKEKAKAFGEAMENIFTGIKDFLGNTWDKIKSATSSAWESVKETTSSLWTKAKDKIHEIGEGIKTNISQTTESNKKTWGDGLAAMDGDTNNKFTSMLKTIKQKTDENGGIINTAIEGYKNLWDMGFSKMDEITGGKMSAIKGKVDEYGGGIGGLLRASTDGYKQMWGSAFDFIKDKTSGAMEGVKGAISGAMEGAKSIVHGAVNALKGMFNFDWQLPKIKLPHFSISGEFSLMPPKIPKISVNWYKKAYDNGVMFNSPTVIPTASGMKGFGDGNGAEVVIGANNLMNMISEASGGSKVDAMIELLSEYLPVIAEGGNVYLDKGVLVGQITPDINRRLGLAYR